MRGLLVRSGAHASVLMSLNRSGSCFAATVRVVSHCPLFVVRALASLVESNATEARARATATSCFVRNTMSPDPGERRLVPSSELMTDAFLVHKGRRSYDIYFRQRQVCPFCL